MKMFHLSAILLAASCASALGQVKFPVVEARFVADMPEYVRDVKMIGSQIACLLASGNVVILDRKSGKFIVKLKGDDRRSALIAISREGPYVATGLPSTTFAISRDGALVATGGVRERIPSAPHGTNLSGSKATSGEANKVDVSFIKSSEAIKKFWHYGPLREPVLNQAPTIPHGGVITIYHPHKNANIQTRADFPNPIVALIFHETRLTVIDNEFNVVVLNEELQTVKTQQNNHKIHTNIYPNQNLVFDNGNLKFAGLSDELDGRIKLFCFDAETKHTTFPTREEGSPAPWAIAITPDGRKLATCGPNGSITVRDFESGNVQKAIKRDMGEVGDLDFIAFGSDHNEIVTAGSDGLVRVWNVETGRVVFTAKGPKRDARAASLVDDELTLVSGAYHYAGQTIEPLVIETFQVKRALAQP